MGMHYSKAADQRQRKGGKQPERKNICGIWRVTIN